MPQVTTGEEMERNTIRRIRDAVRTGRLGVRFTAIEVNKALGIYWSSTFLAKHRKGNPGGYTVLFIRVERGVYELA